MLGLLVVGSVFVVGIGLVVVVFDLMYDQVCQWDVVGMVVVVVDQGQFVYECVEGLCGDVVDIQVDVDILFKIVFNSKVMIVVLLVWLVECGWLCWDDLVICYLLQFCMYDLWVIWNMQVCDLFVYNSGLGLGVGDLMLWFEFNYFICQDIIVGLVYFKLVISFCSGYVYDNFLYVVVGEVVVVVGGKFYDELLCEEVFVLLGMMCCQVGVWLVVQVGNVVQLYWYVYGWLVVEGVDGDISFDLFLMVVGGICCSLCDMICWMQVLFDFILVLDWLGSVQWQVLWIVYMLMLLGECQCYWDNVYVFVYGYGW